MAIKPVFSFAALVGRGLVLAALAGCSNDVTPAPPGGDGGAGGSSASGQTSVAEQSAATGMSGPAMPAGMDHRTDITFEGKQIQCKLGPLPVPYDVPDCATKLTAPIAPIESGDLCEACDRTYAGPFTYLEDSCSELAGSEEPATEGSFGFRFVSDTERELWGKNDEGVWEKSVDLTQDDRGAWTSTITDALVIDPPDCNNGEQDLGTFTIVVTFTDTDG